MAFSSLQAEEHYQIIHPKTHKASAQSALSKQGKEMVKAHNCLECHSVESKGGCLAPPLDGIGAYRGKNYILARITRGEKFEKRFEKLHPEGELMPHLRLPLEQSQPITAYLLTLPAPKGGYKIYNHNKEEATKEAPEADTKGSPISIAEGRKIFSTAGCLACHAVNGMGGHFAPSLDGTSKRRNRSYVERIISKAELMPLSSEDTSEYSERGNIMPPSGLNAEQIKQVTDFIMTL